MIRSSARVMAGVAVLSLAVHAAAAILVFQSPTAEMQGGTSGAVKARLGTSFADFAAGTLVPTDPDAVDRAVPAAVQQVEHGTPLAPVSPEESADRLAPISPEGSESVILPNATRSEAYAALPVARSVPVKTAQSAPVAANRPALETLKASTSSAVEQSLRPNARSSPSSPTRTTDPTETQGNNDRNAVAGTVSGSATGLDPQRSARVGTSTEQGNANANNYPGEVLRRIAGVPKPRVDRSARAVVQFSIGGEGSLRSIAVAQSSGSSRFDSAALRVIQSAAPFPPPPPGAQRRFRITIEGR